MDTFNLTDRVENSPTPVAALAGVRMSLLDSAGHTLPVLMTTAGPLSVEAVMPDAASPGTATLIVQPAQGPSLSQGVTIRHTAPGLYTGVRTATPRGYASDSEANLFPLVSCTSREGCYATRLPLSSTPGGLDFVLYGTGLRAASGPVRLGIGTHTLDSVEIRPYPAIAGVDELRFHLPREFPLRLYQAISVDTLEGASNYLWIYLE